jgi:hypothetical protein
VNGHNVPWDLSSFVEALTQELDRTHGMLRVKAVNLPLTYTVRDVALDLQVFAEYDGDAVRFRTAQPNEEGSSKLELKLGSITDKVVAETTKDAPHEDDVHIEEVPGLDDTTRKSLKRVGVDSTRDLKKLGAQKLKVRTAQGRDVDFAALAEMMDAASRPRRRPQIDRVEARPSPSGGSQLQIFGTDLDEVIPHGVHLNGGLVKTRVSPGVLELSVPDAIPAGELLLDTLSGESLRVNLVE